MHDRAYIPATRTTMGQHILKDARLYVLMALAVPLVLFGLGYAGAAVTAAGMENWHNVRVSNVQQ